MREKRVRKLLLLDEIAREGTRRMLREALRAEANDYVPRHRGARGALGGTMTVGNRRGPAAKAYPKSDYSHPVIDAKLSITGVAAYVTR
jgi:hypothetical protein